MKLRAPRCSDARLLTSFPAGTCQLAPPPCSAAKDVPPTASARTATSARVLVRMVGHPLGRRLHRVDARIPGHENEVREVDDREYAREEHIEPLGGLQAEIHQHQE